MINESWPWKKELRRLAKAIAKVTSAPVPEDLEDFILERPLFYSAFVIRKLLENWKVTDGVRDQMVPIKEYPANQDRLGALLRLTMRGDLDTEFHMDRPSVAQMRVWDLVSELIHSGYIAWSVDESEAIRSVLLCSFRNERRRLIEVDVAVYLKVMTSIAEDEVQAVRQWRDDSGKMQTVLE